MSTRAALAAVAICTVGTVLPLGLAAPAHAEEGCLSEDFAIPRCDDSTPPETTITSVSPPLTDDGWLRSTSVTIAFEGHHVDADQDPIGFECRLDQPVSPGSWETCTSPVTYDDLLENQASPYTVQIRAIDTADAAQDVTNPLLGRVDEPDLDATPDEVSFTADATPPNTFGFLRNPYADESGDAPMLVSTTAELSLQSAAASGFQCRLDGEDLACPEEPVVLRGLAAGPHRFVAAAVDAAGNVDPTPYVQDLFVPRNLVRGDAVRSSRGDWTRRRQSGLFGGDYLESSTYGAQLSLPVRHVREIRLIAPAGPAFGKVEVRVGTGRWFPVRLSGQRSRLVVHELRDQTDARVSGRLQVRVASRNKVVRVDAISAR